MKHINYQDVTATVVEQTGAQGVIMRVGISADDKAPNFAMRLFQVEPGGYTPFHEHDWEHEVFIVSGQGALVLESGAQKLESGDFVLVDPGLKHQFKNTGSTELRFICVVPHQT